MSGYVLSPRAQADLEEIWDYSVEIWGTDRAEHYVRKRPTNTDELRRTFRLPTKSLATGAR
jgi:plasmid stabilization system protein ParE